MKTPSDLSARIVSTIREQHLFRAGDTLILGFSGGADSTALLDLLAGLPGMQLRLVAAHLNHGLRGTESDADEEFCRAVARQYRIPFEARRVDVQAIADDNSLNLEDAGRRVRNAFFDELQVTWQATAVALAHHADDQAETVLMRLLRGSGMTGLSGMSYQNRRGYIRPLLGITRSEIEAHLTECGLSWRDDNSNRDTTFLRNRIRHELLPLLEQYNPSVRASLSTAAAILSAENSLLEAQATQAAGQVCRDTAQGCFCSISRLKSLPLALQRRVLRQTLGRLHGNLEQFSHHHIETICKMAAAARPNMQITLPHGIVAVKEYDQVVFRHEDHSQPHTFKLHLPGPGIYQLPDSQLLTIELSSPPEQPGSDGSSTAYFDLDKIPFPWHVRTFHSGDRLQLLGMHGRKKLKDLFIDNKVPLYQRRRTPLILCEQEIVWVCGLRTSHLARLDGNSTQVAKVVFSRME